MHRTTSQGIVHTTVRLSAQYTACPAVCVALPNLPFQAHPRPGSASLCGSVPLSFSPRYHPDPLPAVGLSEYAHTVCPGLFEELLLLLQPLALLPRQPRPAVPTPAAAGWPSSSGSTRNYCECPKTCYCPPTRPCSWPAPAARTAGDVAGRPPGERVKGVGARRWREEEEEGRQAAGKLRAQQVGPKWAGWLVSTSSCRAPRSVRPGSSERL